MLLSIFCVLVNCLPTQPPLPVRQSIEDVPGFSSEPIVWTPSGGLQGIFMKTRKGRSIAAFLGIPYAQPPLRFSKSIPVTPWNGIRKATEYGNVCLQLNMFKYFILEGSEDCLYLNVYTKVRSNYELGTSLLPVIMFIHGGGHLSGAGSDYGPSYLLDRDVILVTINYRVGILGFLSTGDHVSPGNNALKDQSLALKWISSNIESFGGDPKRVTIMGQSVAGGYVRLHMLSPKSRDLIHGAISHSGSSFNHWAIHNQTISTSNLIAKSFGCPTSSNGKSQEMIKCLRYQNPSLLVSRQLKFYDRRVLQPSHVPLGPVVEIPNEDSFLEEAPQVLYAKNQVRSIPLLSGIVESEGSLFAAGAVLIPGQIDTVRKRWFELLPFVLAYDYDNRAKNPNYVSSKIRDYYFQQVPWSTGNIANISRVLGDRTILQGVYYGLQHHSQVAPTYVYYFNFKGKNSYLKTLGFTPPEILELGYPTHVDDLIYLFNSSSLYGPISVDDREDFAVSQFMTNVWANFAAFGKPLFTDKKNQLVEFWEPERNPYDMRAMEINLKPRMVPFPFKDRVNFWSALNLKDDFPFKSN